MKNKKMMKLVISLLLVFSLASPAMAEEKQIAIQLNGEWLPMTDSVPMMKEGRVFVPFRAVLEALEAEVSYDASERRISAARGTRKLEMQVGNPVITLTVNNTKALITTDAPSFIENGRTYVPVRFVAQALDCKVGWDTERQAVIILDMDKIAEKTAGSYQLMDKLQAYTRKNTEGNYELTGNISFAVTNEMEEKVFKANLNGQNHSDALELLIKLEPDTMSLAHTLLKEEGCLTSEGERLLRTMEDVQVDLFFDKKDEQVYIASELLTILYGLENKWYQLDLEALGLENDEQLWMINESEKIATLIEKLLNQISLTDSRAVAADLRSIYMLQETCRDDKFKKEENGYCNKYTEKINGITLEIANCILMRSQQVKGYESLVTVVDETMRLEIFNAEKEQKHIWKINLETDEEKIKFEGELDYRATTKAKPQIPAQYDVLASFN